MSGGSAAAAGLGLRSGSYGSLPAAVGGSGGAGGVRKPGARGWALRGEKERLQLLHRALRLVGRRRAGVLLLLAVASAAVFCSLFAVVKGPRDADPNPLLPARLLVYTAAARACLVWAPLR